MAYNVLFTIKKLFGDSCNLQKLSSNSKGMQSTFGVEVLESRSGSFVKIVTKKYRKISSDGFQRGELFLMTKRKEERFANTKLRLMPSMRTSRYAFMITRGCLERTRKA